MKRILLFAAIAALFVGCADKKTFTKSDGTEFTAKPYGWMDTDKKIPGVEYDLCVTNIVLSVVFSETIAAPILLTGLELWEPEEYVEPKE